MGVLIVCDCLFAWMGEEQLFKMELESHFVELSEQLSPVLKNDK